MQQDDGAEHDIAELWTTSHTALVLTGPVAMLVEIGQHLALPGERVIETRYGQATLGLWGEPLTAYQELTRRSSLLADRKLIS
jgi:hypothetical protein